LAQRFHIHVDPVVGYVNDGEGEVMASHAWVEFGAKKIDLSLTLTERPDIQPSGPLLVLDRPLTKGRAVYTYHRERGPSAARQVQELMKDPTFRDALLHKEAEHERMGMIARDRTLMLQYLDSAPDGFGYEQLAQRVGNV
jgi:hypothetical protein